MHVHGQTDGIIKENELEYEIIVASLLHLLSFQTQNEQLIDSLLTEEEETQAEYEIRLELYCHVVIKICFIKTLHPDRSSRGTSSDTTASFPSPCDRTAPTTAGPTSRGGQRQRHFSFTRVGQAEDAG